MTYRNIIITGVTGSIGKATVKELSKTAGVNLILCGRNLEEIHNLKSSLSSPAINIDTLQMDLSDLSSVSSNIKKITSTYQTIYAIVNIAAVVKKIKTITKDNLELMFQVNYMSPFYFTTMLTNFYADEEIKVVTLSSSSTSRIDLDNLNGEKKFSPIPNFSQSKTCTILFVNKLARQFALYQRHISIGFDPGIVKSNSMKELPRFFTFVAMLLGQSPDNCARTLTKLIFSDGLQSGSFYNKNGHPISTGKYANDQGLQDKLWDKTMDMIAIKRPSELRNSQ